MSFDYDLLCIGSGPAGQRAAIQAAKAGKRVAVVERSRHIGGGCLGNGTIPSKTFREAVCRVLVRLAADDGLGLAPKKKARIEDLVGRVADIQRREGDVLRHQLQRNDVNLISGDATFAGPQAVDVKTDAGVHRLTAAHIMVAVGTVPSQPPGVDCGSTVVVSDAMVDLERLPNHLIVVGAGVIGMEYASMFAMLGCKVTVVDRRRRPLEFLDGELVDELIHQLRQRRVVFRPAESVASVQVAAGDQRALVELESGKRLVGDMVLFSIGRRGATANLGLEHAGLTPDDRGRLTVDENYRTAVPSIYAAGDVIGFPALAATSAEQGRLAARHMFGLSDDGMAPHFPIGIYSIPEVSMVGQTEEALTEARVPYETGLSRYRETARGQILDDHDGLLKLIFHRESGVLLGAHAIGTGATELIHIGQAVMALGGGLDYFLKTVFNYPTLAECYKVAALNAANKIAEEEALEVSAA
ncbi:MAG: Si-specific NAD(P)(+) transhydrogenase [Myxococcota bacterium]